MQRAREALHQLVDEVLVLLLVRAVVTPFALAAVGDELLGALGDAQQKTAERQRLVGCLADHFADAVLADRALGRIEHADPRVLATLQHRKVHRELAAKVRQRAARVDIALVDRLPACAEPQEARRSLGDVRPHVGVDAQLGADVAKCRRPVVVLGRIPARVVGQLQVELLHDAALAIAGLGREDRHARAGELAVGLQRCGLLEESAEPGEFAFAAEEGGGHGAVRVSGC